MRFRLLLFFLVLFDTNSFSQNFTIGFKSGINQSTLTGFSVPSSNAIPKLGYLFGLITDTDISDKFSIFSEVLFIEKGITYNGTNIFETPDFKNIHKMGYVDLCSALKFNFNDRIGIRAGIYVGFMRYYNIKTVINANQLIYIPQSQRFQIYNDDIGLTSGVSGGITNNLFLDFSYRIGINSLYYLDAFQVYNETFSFAVRYMFDE